MTTQLDSPQFTAALQQFRDEQELEACYQVTCPHGRPCWRGSCCLCDLADEPA